MIRKHSYYNEEFERMHSDNGKEPKQKKVYSDTVVYALIVVVVIAALVILVYVDSYEKVKEAYRMQAFETRNTTIDIQARNWAANFAATNPAAVAKNITLDTNPKPDYQSCFKVCEKETCMWYCEVYSKGKTHENDEDVILTFYCGKTGGCGILPRIIYGKYDALQF